MQLFAPMAAIARILVGGVLVLVGPTAWADRTLTLDEAVALARAHNRDLRAGRARLEQAEAGVAQARAALLPTVTGQGKYTHNYKEVDLDISEFSAPTTGLAETIRGTTTNPAEAAAIASFEQQAAQALASQPPIVIQKGEQLDASVTATVPLVAPAGWYGYSAAKSTAHAGEASYAVTEASVLVGVAEAYFAAAGTDELVVARRHAVTVANETFSNAKARVGSDLANPVDVTRAETALVRAQQDLVEAETSRSAAHRALATILGTHDELTLAPIGQAAADPGAVSELVPRALGSRPEIAVQRTTIDAAEATARSNAWKWSPTVSGFGNARAFNYAGFSGDKYSWAVGLELDWVLYDGGARDAQRRVADAQRAEAEARLDLLHDTISDEVANAHDTLETKRKAVNAAQRQVALANESLRLTRAQYDAGTAKQLDVLQAQDSVIAAEVGLAQAHFEVSLADVQLRRAAGTFPGRNR
ncbi:MAG TPA: TolC family protein [Kofleriaceae bacterium]|nr:TolC family protein [Kofleriaceae bacterium]